jgi:hypothetical protein
MKWIGKNLGLIMLMIAAVAFTLMVNTAWGDEGHGHDHHDDGGDVTIGGTEISTGDMIGGDTSVLTGNNKALTIVAPGLADVDIAQCLGSEAWTLLVGGKQKLVLNQVCMAEFYLKQGRYDLAAQSLCNQEEILREYGTEADCEAAHDFTPAVVEGHDSLAEFENHHEVEEQHTEELVQVQMAQTSIEDRLRALENKPAPRPRVTQSQAAPEPKYSEEDMAYVLGLYQKGEPEDE